MKILYENLDVKKYGNVKTSNELTSLKNMITYLEKHFTKHLALEDIKNFTEIAYEYGFCGASYYCETFQKYYRMSPLKYRKQHCRPQNLTPI